MLTLQDASRIAFEGVAEDQDPIKPPWSVKNLRKRDVAHEWLQNTIVQRREPTRDLANRQIMNNALFKGINYSNQDARCDFRDRTSGSIAETDKVVAPYHQELGRQRVAKMITYIPATRVVPATDTYEDRERAKSCDKLLDSIKYTHRYKRMLIKALMNAYIFGDQPVWITWNKDAGRVDPDWAEAAQKLRDKSKSATKGRVRVNGKYIDVDLSKPKIQGDIELDAEWLPWLTVFDPKPKRTEVEWTIRIRYEHIEKIKRDHPGEKWLQELETYEKNGSTSGKTYFRFNPESLEAEPLPDHRPVYELFAKSSKYLYQGLYLKGIPEGLLQDPEDLPYDAVDSEFGNMPLELFTDLDYPGHIRGASTINLLSNLANKTNRFLSDGAKCIELASLPKAFLPNGSGVKIESLANPKATVIRYNAPFKPEIANFTGSDREIFAGHEVFKAEFFALGGSGPIGQGDIPKQLKSGIAIRMVKQFEDIRNSDAMEKMNDAIVAIDRKTLTTVKRNYKEDEERLIYVVGKDKSHLVQQFLTADLEGALDVEVLTLNALSKDPAGKIQDIFDLQESTKDLPEGPAYTRSQYLKILDYPEAEGFKDPLIAAASQADRENEMFLDGRKVEDPRKAEDLVTHHNAHCDFYRTKEYEDLSDKAKEAFEDHMMGTEYLMFDLMADNLAFEQRVITSCQNFPSFSDNYLDMMKAAKGTMLATPGMMGQGVAPNPLTTAAPAPGPGAAAPMMPQAG